MMIAFLLEISLVAYLVIYMISFFVERDIRFVLFFVMQVALISLGILFSTPLQIVDFYLLSVDYVILFSKHIALFAYIIFLIFFYFWFRSNLNSPLVNLDKLNGLFEFLLLSQIFLISGLFFIESNEFLLIYIFLEVQSIALYIMAAFQFDSNRATEAALKYFIFGAIFSSVFILGWIFVFASTGLSNFFDLLDIWVCLTDSSYQFLTSNAVFLEDGLYNSVLSKKLLYFFYYKFRFLSVGFFFIFIAIIAKLGLFPFNFWIIDVYDSISSIALLFFSVFPKLFLLTFLLRLNLFFQYFVYHNWHSNLFEFLIGFIAIGSVLWGSITNLSQWKLHRFIAFSSIVNLGYIMFFFIPNNFDFFCIMGIFLNLINYFFLVFAFFSNLLYLKKNRMVDNVTDINELFLIKNSHPLVGISFFINMLSFAGVPPLLGFFGKFYLLCFLWFNGLYLSLFFVLFVSFISAFYYIRLARTLFNFNSNRILLRDISFSIWIMIFFFILIQLFFIIIFVYYFNVFSLFFKLI